METIFKRVSIRKYESRAVEQEKIVKVLVAAMAAPSAGNQQPWEFHVVRDRDMLLKLSQISKYSSPVAAAPAAIVNVCDTQGRRFAEVAPVDMANCTEHEWLEATDLGLGAVWIGVYPFEDRIKEVNKILGLPEGKYAFSILTLGYPAETRQQQDRFDKKRIYGLYND